MNTFEQRTAAPINGAAVAYCVGGRFVNRPYKDLGIEYVLIHSFEGFLHSTQGQGQVHADVAGAMEGSSVLHIDANFVAGFQHFVQRLAVLRAPSGAIDKEHVCALGFGNGDALPMRLDEIAGKFDIFTDDLP